MAADVVDRNHDLKEGEASMLIHAKLMRNTMRSMFKETLQFHAACGRADLHLVDSATLEFIDACEEYDIALQELENTLPEVEIRFS